MNRFKFIFWLMILTFLVIIQKLFFIQILSSSKNIPIQKYLQVSKQTTLRGEIFDANKVSLVLNKQTFNVYADIVKLKKNHELQQILEKTLQIKNSTMSAFLRQDKWRRIKNQVSVKQKEQLQSYYPLWLNFEDNWIRHYPEGSSSAYLLGFVGKDEIGQPKGYVGIEGYYDLELKGAPVVKETESDFMGIPLIGGIYSDESDLAGLDIYLTIDIKVQKMVEAHLYDGLELYQAKNACAIVINPNNGQLIALVCVPGYDPREYYSYADENFINPAVASVFEPGSTFKPLVVAMALEEGKIKSSTIFPETGPYRIGEYEINTWDNKYRGKVNTQEILEKSSNIGMVHIIERLKKQQVSRYFDKLGLRELTGIQLEGEVNSLIKPQDQWYPIDFATYSFGQGLAITPIQLVRAFSSLANGGFLIKPTLLKSFYDNKNGQMVNLDRMDKKRVFSTKVSSQLKKMLYNSIEHAEVQWPNKPDGYRFCGKTGTSQIPVKGVYDASKTIASFIGFFPCKEPKYLILTLYQEPKSSSWGSETAAPTFFEIANSLILYYNIAP